MELFFSPTSPYVRKVLILANEIGIADQIEFIDRHPHPVDRDPSIVAKNPTGKVPTLLLDDGTALYDSRVICRYLASLSTGPTMYPTAASDLWQVLTLEALADGLLDAALIIYYETFERPKDQIWEDWLAGQWEKIDSTVDEYERVLDNYTGQVNAATIAIACTLGYLDFRFEDHLWRPGHAGIQAWYEEFAKRPSMQATVPYLR
ncbi:MAG: glutathione S-transferase N-terminal domain-containing protein [Woeseiaceae bacterium]|jgi:glutathione S-transferase|nr:glutathione S-transferase N-terminal domain-containing protein [Woeseiaceae bacterium]MDP7490352.1 glutathione S-transferase N-terminal domain-containing protein [Arenicellales bacterium]|tara:strand:+ start:549 stop:1163 length:615 start_codon:yes stop_codon:yes gene_type:complete